MVSPLKSPRAPACLATFWAVPPSNRTTHAIGIYSETSMSLRDRLSACDTQVRAHLDPDERVLAIGKCEDVTEWGGPERGGGGWTYLMVTDRRLRWVLLSQRILRGSAATDVLGVCCTAAKHDAAI